MKPSSDPNIPHPGRVFYGGQWRTPEAVDRKRELTRERQRERYANDPEYRELTRERNHERVRKYQRRNLEDGLCRYCAQPLLSESYCWDCLNKKEERRALAI